MPALLQGLTSTQAAARLTQCGPNLVALHHRTPVWRRVAGQFRDPLVAVLLVAVALTVVTGDWPDAAIISLVIVVNTGVGVAQEVRADDAVAALSAMSAAGARVVRDGEPRVVPAEQVVPGDLVLLGEGDIVPADAELIEAVALLVDESMLTGESVPVEKTAGSSSVSSGTVVVHGRGRALVTATGRAAAVGGIAALMAGGPTLTPLQRRMADLGRTLAVLAAALSCVVAAVGLVRGEPLELMLVTAISLMVAAVPESLPAVVTLGLAVGARRMSARNAIVRRLPAIETLGAVTVIATDKTGTLTEGRMSAEWLWTPQGEAWLTGTGFGPGGSVMTEAGPVGVQDRPDLAALLRAAVLCNDAALQPAADPDAWQAVGDPTEAALLVAAAKLGLDRAALAAGAPRVFELPFDSHRRRMTTVHRLPDGARLVVCKGAPESLLAAGPCERGLIVDTDLVTARARERAQALSEQGYRVLAVAQREARGDLDPCAVERDLQLLGLVALADPPKAAAGRTVDALLSAGIVPVLITGDHVSTALAMARRVGIATTADAAVSGLDLDAGSPPDLERTRVFARTSPAHKLDLVRAWQQAGQVVAMTGDGVNDGPALRHCDIGVAMGRHGTEVARQAADLVLADDDLATLVGAVEEGRRVYDNIRRFLLYGLAGGTAELMVMLAGPALGLTLPLLPAQILWVNLLTHGLPGVAMGSEPAEPGVMTRPPRPPEQRVLGERLWQRIGVLATVVAATSLGTGLWAQAGGRPWQSMLFVALGATQLGLALGVRARPGTWTNPFLLWAVAVAFVLQVTALYLPPLPELLGTTGLGTGDLALVGATVVVGYLAARLDGLRHRAVTTRRGPA